MHPKVHPTPRGILHNYWTHLQRAHRQLHQLILFFFVCIAALACKTATAANAPIPLDQPLAFCLSALSECTPDKYQSISTPVAYDIRPLNDGKNEPITLVYEVPSQLTGQKNVALMVSPSYRNHCFQLDTQRSQTICSNRELLTFDINPDASQILTQNVQGDDPRLVKPNMLIGGIQDLHAVVLSNRTPVIGLAGWYAFLAFAALFQLLTHRNRLASLSVAMLAIGMFCRTITTSQYAFSGITLFGSFVDRRLEYFTLALLGIFFITFYGTLIGNRLQQLRRAIIGFYALAGLFIVLAQQPQHVTFSLQFVQVAILVGVILSVVCVVIAFKLLQRRESLLLLVSTCILATGVILDLITAIMTLPLLLGGTGLGPYCFALDTLCQFILIALRNDTAHLEAQRYQKEQIETQALLVQTLKDSENQLNIKVEQRTAELNTAKNHAEAEQHKAEEAREQTALAMEELKATQSQLIAAEKMASLGLLVSNVAHEINTPIGAIVSSGITVSESMDATLENMPKLLDSIDRKHRDLFLNLITQTRGTDTLMSTRDERTLTKKVTAELEAAGIEGAIRKARLIVRLRAFANTQKYLPLLSNPDTDFILSVATGVADVLSGTSNINTSAAKISRIVASLKELSGEDRLTAMFEVPMYQSIEKAIAALENKLFDMDVVRNY